MPGGQLALQRGPAQRPFGEQPGRLGDDRRDVLTAQPLAPAVAEAKVRSSTGCSSGRSASASAAVTVWIVVRMSWVRTTCPRGHQPVQLGRVVVRQPVPERQMRHARHLRLQPDQVLQRRRHRLPRPAPAAAAGPASRAPARGGSGRRSELHAAGQRAVHDEVRAGGPAGHRAGQDRRPPSPTPRACPCARSGSARRRSRRAPGCPARSAARRHPRSTCCPARPCWPAPRARASWKASPGM